MKHADMEFIPNQFPEGYTMRAERIRQAVKAVAVGIAATAISILFWMGAHTAIALLWGAP